MGRCCRKERPIRRQLCLLRPNHRRRLPTIVPVPAGKADQWAALPALPRWDEAARKRKQPGSDHANAASRQEIGPMKVNLERQRNEALAAPEGGGSSPIEQRVAAADPDAVG